MATYVLRRLVEALGVIVAVTFVVFALLHLTGDPVRLMLPPEAPQQEVEALRRTLGLDVAIVEAMPVPLSAALGPQLGAVCAGLHAANGVPLLTGVTVGDLTADEALASSEMLLLGSSVKVAPIVQWDTHTIGDGKPGPVAKALLRVLEEDMRSGDRLIDVPY